MSTKKLIYRSIICAFLIPIFVVPFINIFSIHTNLGLFEKYGMFATYDESPYILVGRTLSTAWMIINNALVILLFVAAIVYILMFILDIVKVEIRNSDRIIKYLGVLILIVSALAILSGLIASLANHYTSAIDSSIFIKLHGEPGYYLQFFPLVAGILALIPFNEE